MNLRKFLKKICLKFYKTLVNIRNNDNKLKDPTIISVNNIYLILIIYKTLFLNTNIKIFNR